MAERSVPEDDLDQMEDQILQELQETRSQRVSIITFGRTGSGKTALAASLAGQKASKLFKSKEGWDADTSGIHEAIIQVGEAEVSIVDTRGMLDRSKGNHDDTTIQLVGELITNDRHGIIVVCIEMFERLDKSTLKLLTQLHTKYGWIFWQHVVIALTKADRYQEQKWMQTKDFWTSKDAFLKNEFLKNVADRREAMKKCFTDGVEDVQPGCHIGMTTDQFNFLKIPIIPTSQLNDFEMARMQQVGYRYWFDELILECCKREQGAGIVQIHEKRLSNLPADLLVKYTIDEKFSSKFRRTTNKAIEKIAFALKSKLYWRCYCKYLAVDPRFELSRKPQLAKPEARNRKKSSEMQQSAKV